LAGSVAAVKVGGSGAENMAVTTQPTTSKKPPKAGSQPKPATTAKAVRATRPTTTKPISAKPVVATPPVPIRAATPRRKRPMIALVSKADGRALSFTERLAELRHKQFKHAGPVCHSCQMSASELARASAPLTIAG
jgi:hypothetical protein